jgi:hypothetical protein
MTTNKQKAKFETQRTLDSSTLTGSFIVFGAPLTVNPALLIFQNTSTVDITISDDGVNNGLTIPVGTSMVLDLRTNRTPEASDLSFRVGTQFYINGSAGTGNVYLSIIYAS